MLPPKCSEIRFLQRPFWGSSRAVVAIACNFLAAICAHAKPVDIEFPQENSRTAGVVTVVTGGEIVVRRALKMYN